MAAALAGGAAQRRRERRLRWWLRHERQTVAMVLAEACHHSSGCFPPTLKERRMAGQDAYEAPRGQKTARTAGLHPDELVEPGVQGRAVTVGYVAGVDGLSHRYLFGIILEEKIQEEERRKAEEKEKDKATLLSVLGAQEDEETEEEEEDSQNSFLSRGSHSEIWTFLHELFLVRLLWRCHEFGGVWFLVCTGFHSTAPIPYWNVLTAGLMV